MTKSGENDRNAPAVQEYLVPGKPAYFGDYFTLQTDKFIFPAYADLGSVIQGTGGSAKWGLYRAMMADPKTADVL